MREKEAIKVATYRGMTIYRNGRWFFSSMDPQIEWSSVNQVMNDIDESFGFKMNRPIVHYYITQQLEFQMN